MTTEREWVKHIAPKLKEAFANHSDFSGIKIETGKKLTYAHQILRYPKAGLNNAYGAEYETDLLVYDLLEDEVWIPRVVLECKKGSVTTHDALTYSTKAESHKRVHPYLRYGILVGDFGSAIPGRLIRHGAYFDFMMVWHSEESTAAEWDEFVDVVIAELRASRELHDILSKGKFGGHTKFRLLHRPLRLKK